MRDAPLLLLCLLMLPFVPPHLFCWEVLGIVVGVPVVGFGLVCIFVRIYFGHWPK